jgi:hypothetical protein
MSGFGELPDPEQQNAALERLKFFMSQMPNLAVPIHPPPVLSPRVIIPPKPVAESTERYSLAGNGTTLWIIDARDGQACIYSMAFHRQKLDELLALANRPD